MKIKDIVEARMSAAVKLQRAFEREQAKSSASRDRADRAKAEFEKEWKAKQEKEKQGVAEDSLEEKWSQKYKSSINCSNPKGFSQKAHCDGKNKNEEAAGVGIITKQNTTADVNKNTPKKNLRAFRL
jgi:hypothetical protein